jgi:hypothetical protein
MWPQAEMQMPETMVISFLSSAVVAIRSIA